MPTVATAFWAWARIEMNSTCRPLLATPLGGGGIRPLRATIARGRLPFLYILELTCWKPVRRRAIFVMPLHAPSNPCLAQPGVDRLACNIIFAPGIVVPEMNAAARADFV